MDSARGRDRRRRGMRRHYLDQVAVIQETGAAGNQHRIGCNAAGNRHPVCQPPSGLDFELADPAIGIDAKDVTEAVTDHDRLLRHRQCGGCAQFKFPPGKHASLDWRNL